MNIMLHDNQGKVLVYSLVLIMFVEPVVIFLFFIPDYCDFVAFSFTCLLWLEVYQFP